MLSLPRFPNPHQISMWKTDRLMRPIHVVAYDEPGAIIKHSVIGLPEEMPDTNSQVLKEQRRAESARQGLLRGKVSRWAWLPFGQGVFGSQPMARVMTGCGVMAGMFRAGDATAHVRWYASLLPNPSLAVPPAGGGGVLCRCGHGPCGGQVVQRPGLQRHRAGGDTACGCGLGGASCENQAPRV